MRKPKVSILIPTWNRGRLLPDAIATCFAQTFQDFEIVVYDDGSEDGTEERLCSIKDRRFRFFRGEKNRGVGYARNQLLERMRAPIGCWLDSDDFNNRWRLEILYRAIRKWHPPFVRSAYLIYNKADPRQWARRPPVLHARRHAPATGMFYKRCAGQFNPKIDCGGEDVIWELNMTIAHGTGILIPLGLYVIRRGKNKRVSKRINAKHMKDQVDRSYAIQKEQRAKLNAILERRSVNPWSRVERIPTHCLELPFPLPEAKSKNYGLPPPKGRVGEWRTSQRCPEGI